MFPQKLLPEIGAFAMTCISYALRVLERSYYPRSEKMKQLLDKIAVTGDPLKAFLSDRCVLAPQAKVPIKSLFITYREYCTENDNKNLSKPKMTAALEDMHIGIERKSIRDPKTDSVVWGLVGLRLRTENDPFEETEAAYQADELLACHAVTTPVDIVDVPLTSDPMRGQRETLLYGFSTATPSRCSIANNRTQLTSARSRC